MGRFLRIRMATFLMLLSGCARAQILQLSDTRAICAEGLLSKNFESNQLLSDVLKDYCESFERHIRYEAQRAARVEFRGKDSQTSDRGRALGYAGTEPYSPTLFRIRRFWALPSCGRARSHRRWPDWPVDNH
jgi:hypothetical protein